ncbi:putative nucleic acid-binding protein [Helianthus annuus]|uniref:Nucleic acid-binding protein n=1 Tax=Helianthus annuus TaxID=4232 RepID=A0A9K3N423_HELAN|nr:putative nucleic acid-binding protein [Helianthus annuus]
MTVNQEGVLATAYRSLSFWDSKSDHCFQQSRTIVQPVHEYNGKSIGTISSSQLVIESDFPEAHKLKEWFNGVGRNAPTVPMSRESVSRTDKKTVISQTQKAALREAYKNKKYLPLDLRPKKA